MSATARPNFRTKPPRPTGIQKLVTSGHRAERSRHLSLTVLQPALAPQFLNQLCIGGWLVDANQPWDGTASHCALSLGITFAGLQQLGVEERLLDVLRAKAPAFAQGAWSRASDQLGDIGDSSGPGCLNNIPPSFKWTPGGLPKVQSCPRRRWSLATNRPTRWATRGAPGISFYATSASLGSRFS